MWRSSDGLHESAATLVSIWKHLDSAVIIFPSFKSEIKMLTVAGKLLCWRVQAGF